MRSSPAAGAIPEEGRVGGDQARGASAVRGRMVTAGVAGLGAARVVAGIVAAEAEGGVRGAEFEDAEVHGGYRLVAGEPGAAGGDEPPFAERGALGAGDVEEGGPDGQVLADLQVAVVGLVAVGRDHRGVAGFVQDYSTSAPAGRRPRGFRAGRASSRPGSWRAGRYRGRRESRGRSPRSSCGSWGGSPGCGRRRGRLSPDAARRGRGRRGSRLRRARRARRSPGRPGQAEAGGGDEAPRWISFTPPPKVSTMLRLSWMSSQVINSAVS